MSLVEYNSSIAEVTYTPNTSPYSVTVSLNGVIIKQENNLTSGSYYVTVTSGAAGTTNFYNVSIKDKHNRTINSTINVLSINQEPGGGGGGESSYISIISD